MQDRLGQWPMASWCFLLAKSLSALCHCHSTLYSCIIPKYYIMQPSLCGSLCFAYRPRCLLVFTNCRESRWYHCEVFEICWLWRHWDELEMILMCNYVRCQWVFNLKMQEPNHEVRICDWVWCHVENVETLTSVRENGEYTLACQGDTLASLWAWFHLSLTGTSNLSNDFSFFFFFKMSFGVK